MSCRAFFLRGVLIFALLPGSLATARPLLLAVVDGTAWGQTPGGGPLVREASTTVGKLVPAPATSASRSSRVPSSVVGESSLPAKRLSPAQELELWGTALQPSLTPSSWVFGRTAMSGVRSFLERTVFLVF